MPDVEVNQTNTPPPPASPAPPPPQERSGTPIWPIVVILLVIGALLVWFIFSQDRPSRSNRTEIDLEVPAVEVPAAEAPDEVNVELPDSVNIEPPKEIDVNVTVPEKQVEKPQAAPGSDPEQ